MQERWLKRTGRELILGWWGVVWVLVCPVGLMGWGWWGRMSRMGGESDADPAGRDTGERR